jgi:hypothetical protein
MAAIVQMQRHHAERQCACDLLADGGIRIGFEQLIEGRVLVVGRLDSIPSPGDAIRSASLAGEADQRAGPGKADPAGGRELVLVHDLLVSMIMFPDDAPGRVHPQQIKDRPPIRQMTICELRTACERLWI